MAQFRPIEDYGVIGDLHTVALVGTDGSIDFMCFPDFDSPSVFTALLDPDHGGRFQIAPAFAVARRKQFYLPNTNVLLTRFLSDEGLAEFSGPDTKVHLCDANGVVSTVTMAELLPLAFDSSALTQ